MNKPYKILTLKECKIQASILLKSLKLSNPAIKRKHALAIIAKKHGFSSWNDLKTQINFIVGGFLNHWFAHYSEAKVHQQSQGGFLFPYKNQFFVCDAHYIQQLGFDPTDSDWTLIGKDWAKPTDQVAWNRLYKQWIIIQDKKHD